MNVAVRYFTRSGNTKKVALAIGVAAETEAKKLPETVDEGTDLLFLGSSLYGFNLDDNVVEYINNMDSSAFKCVALFSTAAMSKKALTLMAKRLQAKGIRVLNSDFFCTGQFKFTHKGRPNGSDLKKAGEFAKRAMEEAAG